MPNWACMKLLYLLGIYLREFGQSCKIFQPITKLQALSDSTFNLESSRWEPQLHSVSF